MVVYEILMFVSVCFSACVQPSTLNHSSVYSKACFASRSWSKAVRAIFQISLRRGDGVRAAVQTVSWVCWPSKMSSSSMHSKACYTSRAWIKVARAVFQVSLLIGDGVWAAMRNVSWLLQIGLTWVCWLGKLSHSSVPHTPRT